MVVEPYWRRRGLIVVPFLFLAVQANACASGGRAPAAHVETATDVATPVDQPRIVEPPSWSFPEVIESARAVSARNVEGRPFDQHGLVYSLEVLKGLPIAEMSARELEKYADIVTHAYPDAVARQLPTSCKGAPVDQFNETSVAGIAYISLNAKDPATRRRASICLEEVQGAWKTRGRI